MNKSNSTSQLYDYKSFNHGELAPIISKFIQNQKKDDFGPKVDTYIKGHHYVGHLKSGKPHGFGIMEFKDGTKYDGEWHYNLFNGFGKYWKNGVIFEGIFSKGKFIKGSKYYDTGEILYIDWKLKLPNNLSIPLNPDLQVKLYPNGNQLIASWKYDMPLGLAEIRYVNGDIQTGVIVDQKLHGSGKIRYKKLANPVIIHDAPHRENVTLTIYCINYDIPILRTEAQDLTRNKGAKFTCECRKELSKTL